MRAWGKHFEKPTRSEQRRTCDCDRARQNALARLRAGKLYLVMLWRPCCAGLQLEVAKHIVTAATKVVCQHGATFVLCGIAARGYKTHCVVCAKRRIWVTEATEEVAQKRSSWEKRSLISAEAAPGCPRRTVHEHFVECRYIFMGFSNRQVHDTCNQHAFVSVLHEFKGHTCTSQPQSLMASASHRRSCFSDSHCSFSNLPPPAD